MEDRAYGGWGTEGVGHMNGHMEYGEWDIGGMEHIDGHLGHGILVQMKIKFQI
jgi:hypothetical protein